MSTDTLKIQEIRAEAQKILDSSAIYHPILEEERLRVRLAEAVIHLCEENEKLRKLADNFKDAERVELAIWRSDGVSVMNFYPRPFMKEMGE